MAQSANSTFHTAKLPHGFRIEAETWCDMDRKVHVLWSAYHGCELIDAGYEISEWSARTCSDRIDFRHYVLDVVENDYIDNRIEALRA